MSIIGKAGVDNRYMLIIGRLHYYNTVQDQPSQLFGFACAIWTDLPKMQTTQLKTVLWHPSGSFSAFLTSSYPVRPPSNTYHNYTQHVLGSIFTDKQYHFLFYF